MSRLKDLPPGWQYGDVERAVQFDTRRTGAIDVGAHAGGITDLLTRMYPRVIAVEPTSLADQITRSAMVVQAAMGSVAGRAGLASGKHNTGQTHVCPGDTVDVVLLDEVFALAAHWMTSVSFIKIDVEGMERDVLLGGEITIREQKPVVMLEENGLCKRYGWRVGDAGRLLEHWGFVRVLVLRSNAPDEDWVYKWKE